MPELPEVEVSRLGIMPHLQGRVLTKVVVRQPQLRYPVPDILTRLSPQPVEAVGRRAKYLLIALPQGDVVLHLGMSGSLRVVGANSPAGRHDHLDLVLDSGHCLRFNDPRRFGAVLWQPRGEQLPQLSRLGPEPLGDDFDGSWLYQRSRGRRQAVKPFIMDNQQVVGVGNIYASEALFAAGIDPRRPAGRISKARYLRLADCIRQVLQQAIATGGTTLKDFVQADGKPGYFAQQLQVYGRAGECCNRCGQLIRQQILAQRSTYWCSGCQH